MSLEMRMFKNFLSYILILFLLLRCSPGKSDQPLTESYTKLLFLTTADLPCNPVPYSTSSWNFTDASEDVKAGFLNVPGPGVGHLDLLSGNVQDNATNVTFSLNLSSIPETLGVNLSVDLTEPEYEWTYSFFGGNSYKIGIVHYSQGSAQRIQFRNLDVMIWRNLSYIGGCGNLDVQGNTVRWVCEKNTIPQLAELSQTATVTVGASAKNNGIRYSDCR
ncbi:hypothetical protein EFP84_20485 [Leptospira kmetyi]|uniref:Uncharacterized protein n=2 Tax=Leptospira kmetyi TaxID=408139 RepID=A0A5F1XMM8_9LEPT|nr:hypothetical protein EFP84_20485 [Leptospira kmetyi]TGK14875.1 hypothetical protein EHO62_15750 [Leptospira kmetyi]TGK33512.1 hypothetical protein EHO66_03095 [Leptospira kmetyi]